MRGGELVWLFAFVSILLLIVAFGCSTQGADLSRRQREVQDCILSGGHARLGPGDTILCERSF